MSKILSEETKKKISFSLKGRIPKNIIKKGHKWSKEAIEKRSSKIGATLKSKGIIPPSRRGTIPWNYEGKTKLQESIRKCFEYRQWRSDVFTRDNFVCQRCFMKGGKLNADHIKEFAVILSEYSITTLRDALECEELWNINNGRALCVPCHRSRKQWEPNDLIYNGK